MSKTNKPEQIKEDPVTAERKRHRSMEGLSETIKDDLYVAVGSRMPDGDMVVDYFYSNELPDFKTDKDNVQRKLKISFSSIQADNDQLLHHLFSKTKQR